MLRPTADDYITVPESARQSPSVPKRQSPSVRKRQLFVFLSFFFSRNRVFKYTVINVNFSQCILKNMNKCIPLCFILYLLTSYVFYLFLLLYVFKNNQKELCHPVYDQVGCMVFGKVRRFGISITLPRGRRTSLAF